MRSASGWGLFLVLFLIGNGLAQTKEIQVKLLDIRGNRKIDTATIRAKIKTREGAPFSLERLREDLTAIYQMGYFEDVRIESEGFEGGVKLTYVVVEKPFVVDVVFLGNNHLGADKLKEKVLFRTQTFLDLSEVNDAADKIRRAYQDEGYYESQVLPVIRTISPEKVVVDFVIKEGDRAYIRKIGFEGNRHLKAKEIKKVLETSQYSRLISWITGSGTYKSDEINADVDRIRDLYLNKGFLQVQVSAPKVTLSPDKKWFEVVFPIVEGESFRINKIAFTGNHLLSEPQLREVTRSKEGETFNRDQIRKDISAMVDLYGPKGYAFANVVPQLNPDPVSRQVSVTFEVTEGDLIHIRQINIFGNNKTRDKVIRRELRVTEQDILDTQALKRSFQRINNLNFFENAEIVPKEVEKGWVDLDVRVKEKSTGTFSVGGGYSSVERIVGLVQVEQGNLFGTGNLLRVKTQIGKLSQNVTLTYRVPYLFDRDISGTWDLYDERLLYFSSYDEKRLGTDYTLGKYFSEYVSGSVTYTLEELQIYNYDVGFNFIGDPLILAQQALGLTTTSRVGVSLSRDTRDFFFDPKVGGRSSISVELAGTFLGGDNAYYRVIGDSSRYFPLWFDTVVSGHVRIGYEEGLEGKAVPLAERFFVGGINTVRGFQFGKAGPIDPVTGDILGGNKELLLNLEYLIPLVPEAKIKWLFFFDDGYAFNNNQIFDLRFLRPSAGMGLRWISPVGPLRIEWGYNLNHQPGEKPWTVEFSIGSLF